MAEISNILLNTVKYVLKGQKEALDDFPKINLTLVWAALVCRRGVSVTRCVPWFTASM